METMNEILDELKHIYMDFPNVKDVGLFPQIKYFEEAEIWWKVQIQTKDLYVYECEADASPLIAIENAINYLNECYNN